MLPSPVSSRQTRPFRRRKPSSSLGAWSSSFDRLHALSARSRVTNLAVLLLAASLAFSLLINIRHWLASARASYSHEGWSGSFKSIDATIARPEGLRRLDHLIMVPGHGVWLGNAPEGVYDEHMWALEHYQNGEGALPRIRAFVDHIRKGVQLADADPNSLLVFSGGATRKSTPLSESTSYLSLALSLSLLTTNPSPPSSPHLTTYERTTTEEHALDSFQNLLFALARFRAMTGHYPARITVVGYAMKAARFAQLHRAALRWPAHAWEYVGIDVDDAPHRAEAERGERVNGYLPYQKDLYGCHGSLLDKRRQRNVHLRAHPYHIAASEMAPLLDWCPGSDSALDEGSFAQVYAGALPWDGL